jgi:hypothetical protein
LSPFLAHPLSKLQIANWFLFPPPNVCKSFCTRPQAAASPLGMVPKGFGMVVFQMQIRKTQKNNPSSYIPWSQRNWYGPQFSALPWQRCEELVFTASWCQKGCHCVHFALCLLRFANEIFPFCLCGLGGDLGLNQMFPTLWLFVMSVINGLNDPKGVPLSSKRPQRGSLQSPFESNLTV